MFQDRAPEEKKSVPILGGDVDGSCEPQREEPRFPAGQFSGAETPESEVTPQAK